MTGRQISRRTLIEQGMRLGGFALAAMATVQTASAADKLCADPKAMDGGQLGIRESLNYVEKSPEAAKTCGNCAFFQAAGDGCGTCMIFTGPANAGGHCDSWSAKV